MTLFAFAAFAFPFPFAFAAANPSDYSVTCGEHQLNVEESFQVDLPVTEVKVHPNYKSAPDGFDIAVYKVTVVKMGPQCLDGLAAMDLWSGLVLIYSLDWKRL